MASPADGAIVPDHDTTQHEQEHRGGAHNTGDAHLELTGEGGNLKTSASRMPVLVYAPGGHSVHAVALNTDE